MSATEDTAVLARLRADAWLTAATFDDEVTPEERPQRYALVTSNAGVQTAQRLTQAVKATTARREITYTIRSVGTTRAQAIAVADRVAAQLLGFIPTVSGRRCWPIRHAISRPAQKDTDPNPPLWYCVDEFDLTSDPG